MEDFKEWTSNKKKSDALRKSLYSIIPILTVIIFLGIGFASGIWHPTWMVFLLIPVAIQIIKLVGVYKGDE